MLLLLVSDGCGKNNPKCIEGASVACTCPSGGSGAQVCTGSGTFSPCSCASAVSPAFGTGAASSKMNTGSRSGPTAEPEPLANEPSLARVVARPQVIVDEEVAIGAHGWQSRGFTLPSARPIQVIADGKTHADKGFTVYVMSSDELDHFRNRATFHHISELQGLKIRSFSQTARLAAGAWTVVVQNSENIINTMVVHLRVVSNPG